MGRRGRSRFRWSQDAGMEVIGVVDINQAILEASCDELQIPETMRFQSIGEAVKGTDAQVATICAANPDHAACLTQCLDAGVHVIIEKPMVETLDDAKIILSKAKEKGLKVAVAQNYRYSPELQTIRGAIQRGEIGRIVSVSVTFHRWRPTRGLYLPLLMNQSIHHFDGIRWILDADPEWCFAKGQVPSLVETQGAPWVTQARRRS
jgi:predicted dehydrogenase